MMRIVADENIPYAREFFAPLGEVTTHPGRSLTASGLQAADILLVRSVTRVNASLLSGTPVRFVATATIGTDHIDLPYLQERNIGFASAPGSNAESVAQYAAAALAFASLRSGRPLAGQTIGIVGAGNCGRRVERVACALGMRPILNDPPLARATGDAKFRPLAEALACDAITLHVPLTREGPDATYNMLSASELAQLKPGALLMNLCRGHVLDEAAALAALNQTKISGLVLDAWENEPRIDRNLLPRVLLGTPHIAGYSFDGKVAGTRMIHEAACRFFDLACAAPNLQLPPAALPQLELDARKRTTESLLTEAILSAYPIHRDDGDLRRALLNAPNPESSAAAFDALRKNFPLRREFAATRLTLHNAEPELLARFATLGFTLTTAKPDGPASRTAARA